MYNVLLCCLYVDLDDYSPLFADFPIRNLDASIIDAYDWYLK